MNPPTTTSGFFGAGTWLLLLLAVLALVPRASAQDLATNSAPLGTNRTAPIVSVGPDTPFAAAIVDPPGVKLPEQGPWTISESDLKDPRTLTIDLVYQGDAPVRCLWGSLSNETRGALADERATFTPDSPYKPGTGIKMLVANLNELIQGKTIYDEKSFALIKPSLSGDTIKLLNQPHGADVARLNRLLLEDTMPKHLTRRPKILFDAATRNYIFVDFAGKTVALFSQEGAKKWTADLGSAISELSHETRQSDEIAGIFPKPDMLWVTVGTGSCRIAWDTGKVTQGPVF